MKTCRRRKPLDARIIGRQVKDGSKTSRPPARSWRTTEVQGRWRPFVSGRSRERFVPMPTAGAPRILPSADSRKPPPRSGPWRSDLVAAGDGVVTVASADHATRGKWLERLFEAVQNDGVEYLAPLEDRWGEIEQYSD